VGARGIDLYIPSLSWLSSKEQTLDIPGVEQV
jgi:hypothetical protein